MSVLLEITRLGVRFGGLNAVQDFSLTVNEGEILGLIGPNGSGKSTVFNLINGVHKPDAGRIVFRGHDITGLAPYKIARHGVSRTHQIVQPLLGLTVHDNCTVGACFGRENLRLIGAREAARAAAIETGLGDRLDALASSLTIAGKRRLELARALSARPHLLLLDEILAGLNPTEIVPMIETIRNIRARGVTVLIVEHIMHAIMSLSDRIVVLNIGRKLAEGSPQEVANNPEVITAYFGDAKLTAEAEKPQ